MKEFMQGFPWAWGPRTPSGRPKFGLGTFAGMILTSIIALLMLGVAFFGDGNKDAEWTGYEPIEQFWICPSIVDSSLENGRFLNEMLDAEPRWVADGHRPFPDIIDVPADQCFGPPPPRVLRIRTCADSVQVDVNKRITCKQGEAGLTVRVKKPSELDAGFDVMLDQNRAKCITEHEFGHAYWGFNGKHSTKATSIMYEGMHNIMDNTIESCGTSREGLAKP